MVVQLQHSVNGRSFLSSHHCLRVTAAAAPVLFGYLLGWEPCELRQQAVLIRPSQQPREAGTRVSYSQMRRLTT